MRMDHVEPEVADILNNYRDHVLQILEMPNREVMTSLIKPLSQTEGGVKRDLALILCDQLLEIL